MDIGRLGVWWTGSWQTTGRDPVTLPGALEGLGYSALWSSGRFDPGLSPHFEQLLATSERATVASGIVSIWHSSPEEIASACDELESRFPGRFLLGLGASHAPHVEHYSRPYSHMVEYLDSLDRAGSTAGAERRVLAALGPKMLELSARRAAGAHPYFVPVEHTARARGILGTGPLLAPEVSVVLESEPARARELARSFTTHYLALPNYANNLRTLGFGEDDLAAGGSDRLVDAVVGWGSTDAVASRVREHWDAGADHVCVQVVTGSREEFPLASYRELAAALV